MIKIYGREFNLEQLKIIVRRCNSVSECVRELGFTYDNGKLRNSLLEIINKLKIDSSHFDNRAWQKQKIKYPKVIKNCPVCNKEFETQKGHPKEKETCSYKCSNTYFSDIRHTIGILNLATISKTMFILP